MSTLQRTYHLSPFSELRVRTGTAVAPVKVLLHNTADDSVAPQAEIFGSELTPGVPVCLPPLTSLAVFTPTGCRLTITAPPATLQECYATDDGAFWMRSVTDIHADLGRCRQSARRSDSLGPRALFVSDHTIAGTSTYVRFLLQFAVRLGYHPLLLDASVDRSAFGFPGCISLYQMQYPIDVEEGMNFVPGVHCFVGSPSKEPRLFANVMCQMSRWVDDKMERSDRSRVGGLFVDYGMIDPLKVLEAEENEENGSAGTDHPIDTLLNIVRELDIDHIFVVQSAWLRHKIGQRAHEMQGTRPKVEENGVTEFQSESMSFKLLLLDALSPGALPYSTVAVRNQRWQLHFFGSTTSPLLPVRMIVDLYLDEGDARARTSRRGGGVRIVSVGSATQSSMSTFMPMQEDEEQKEVGDPCTIVYRSPLELQLDGRVLALSTALEYEQLPDGSYRPLPLAKFESALKTCTIRAFAVVQSLIPAEQSMYQMVLLMSAGGIRKELGLAFFLTEETVALGS